MSNRTAADWLHTRRQREPETGGAIVSLRERGYDWGELVEVLALADVKEARRLAAFFLAYEAKRRPPPGAP